MKQYRITTENIPDDSNDNSVLPADDPIHELKIVQYLAGLNSQQRLEEYRNSQPSYGETLGKSAQEKAEIMRKDNIRPGDPEWFKLWFSLPYLNGKQ